MISLGILVYHQLDVAGVSHTRKFFVGLGLLAPGGSLWLGQWHITTVHITGVPLQPFAGSIDDVRVWHRALDTVAVKQSISIMFKSKVSGLSALWLFDEGQGRTIRNPVHSWSVFYLPEVVSRRPVWQFSYSHPSLPAAVTKLSTDFENETLGALARGTCNKFIFDAQLMALCGKYLNRAHLQFYYLTCLNDIHASGSLDAAFVTVTLYADYCQTMRRLSTWPARHLCHKFPEYYPVAWIGVDCNVKCLFGHAHELDPMRCVCERGYWGSDCAKECPGGASHPCNKHGTCDAITGTCTCDLNWRGNEECGECTPGWTGDDCSVAVSGHKSPTCSAFLGGHFTTFDGSHFNFFGAGEYWLIQSDKFKGQLRQIPCADGHSRCINALAFSFSSAWRVVFHGPFQDDERPVVWLNGEAVVFESNRLEIAGDVYLEQTSSTTYTLISNTLEIDVKMRVMGTKLSFAGRVSPTLCNGTGAVCGNCDGNRDNDFNVTQGAVEDQQWRVPPDESLFVYGYGSWSEKQIPTGGEYALVFKGVGVSTDLIPHIFTGSYVTIELLFKIGRAPDAGGVLLSYSFNTSLTVYIEESLKLRIGSEIWDTGISPDIDGWNQIVLVYFRSTGTTTFYHINSRGVPSEPITRTLVSGCFVAGSTIAVGQWIPSTGGPAIAGLKGFVGLIDEVRFWNREFSQSDVKASWTTNIQSPAPHLAILWKFNEGQGLVVRDLVSGVHLYISTVAHAPRWVFSYASVKIIPINGVIKFYNATLKPHAQQWCHEHIVTSPLGHACTGNNSGSSQYYYRACVRVIATWNSVSVGVDVVVAYADTCQVSLNVSFWPARQMCNYVIFKSTRLSSWIGSNCNIPCLYGRGDAVLQDKCKCDSGFWGKECTGVCPGGPVRFCNGQGSCSPYSGTCSCPFRWRGSRDCKTCTLGYYGTDCSVVIAPPYRKRPITIVSGTGGYVTLDGVKIKVDVTGEFQALVSAKLGLSVQLRQVKVGGYVRVRCVLVRLPGSIVAIHSSIGVRGEVVVTVNGARVSATGVISLGSSGFVFRRTAFKSYAIVGPGGFELVVYHRGIHLDVSITVDKSVCQETCGLLGRCRSAIPSNCTLGSILESYNASLLTQGSLKKYVQQWAVPKNESLFGHILNISGESHVITGAGTCLFFNGTSVVTSPLVNIFVGNYLTLQLFVKAKDPRVHGGTIVSFALNETFAVTVNRTIKLHFGVRVFDTNIVMKAKVWCHISLVYRRDSGLLQFYIINSIGVIQTRVFQLGIGAFPSGGTLAIALWTVTSSVELSVPGFIGWVDELSIWNKRLDPVMVLQSWQLNLQVNTPGVGALWKFNEGSGYVARATVGTVDIYLPTPPWKAPVWFASDANVSVSGEFVPTFRNDSVENSTKELCAKIFLSGPFNKQCANATGQPGFYYETCITEIAASASPEAALVSSVSMATECQAALNLSSLPGQKLCNVLPGGRYNNWVGENCTHKCFVGEYRESVCKCEPGYWGVNCSEECPGGARNPCNGHGQCDALIGRCNCDVNWRGNENCTACSLGWRGKFCSVAVTTAATTNSSTRLCTITANGRVTGFDGSLYTFSNIGEFLMINSQILQAQVRQVPCETSAVCLNAVGLQFSGLELSVHAPYGRDEDPVVYVNGKVISVGGNPTNEMRRLNVTVMPVSSVAYKITLSRYLALRVMFSDRYLSVETTVSVSYCQVIEGLCGSCALVGNATQGNESSVFPGGKPTTVLVSVVNGNTSEDVDAFIRRNLTTSHSVIVIDKIKHKETRVVYGGLYSLYFRFTAVISPRVETLFVGDTITIQFLVRSCDPQVCGGTLISYTTHVTFYISNHVTVKVVIGLNVYDTGIATEANSWNQISIVFHRVKLEMFVYVINSAGLVQVKQFFVKVDPFIPGGTFAIGLWQPASGSISVQPTGIFRGRLDEISIWKRPFDYAMIKESWGINLQVNVPSLTSLWKLNEGEASLVKDTVSGINLFFPKYPMEVPSWIFSDAPIGVISVINPNKANQTLKAIANTVCSELIFQGQLYDACWKLGNITLDFYFRSCLNIVVDSGVVDQSLDIVVTISDYCQATLGLSFWPAQRLCNAFPSRRFPYWIGENCTVPCLFGKASNASKHDCVCDHGYYGKNCSGICPGGGKNACYKNGICDIISGECLCDLNWRGDENCSSCSPGWAGSDCSTAVSQHVSIGVSVGVGGVSIGGYFTTLGGVSFTVHITGEYYLIYSTHVSVVVQVRLVSCFGQSSCINSIALKLSSHTVVLHGPYSSGGAAITWVDGKLVDIDLHRVTTEVYGFSLLKITSRLYELLYPGLHIKIRVDGRYLSLSVTASGVVCKDSIGLLGSCNKPFLESLPTYQPTANCSEGSFNINTSFVQQAPPPQDNSSSSTQDVVNTLVTLKLKVKTCHSLFVYRYKDIVEHREANAGYALYFDHTAVVSKIIVEAFQSTDITIELMFKTVRFGVLISYTNIKTFLVTCAGAAFTVQFGDQVYPTNITAELNSWNQVSLVFRKNTGVLQFYYFASGGLLHRQDITIGADIFVPGGILALAGWQPSLDGSGSQTSKFFAGFIDQVRIWARYFHPAIVLQTWNRSISVEANDLAHEWKFNEGEGVVAVDTVTGIKLELALKPWRAPEWKYSDVRLQKAFYEKKIEFPFGNNTLKAEAEQFCHTVLLSGALHTSCSALGSGVSTFYYRSCLRRIALSGSLYSSLEVIVAFSDYCQAANNLTVWPAKPLCNEFPGRNFPIWFGLDCDRKCVFGVKEAQSSCKCFHGYWDADCSKVCPGGAATPCNNHGLCDLTTGACHCGVNWQGSKDCGRCSPGWTGHDCAVAMVTLPNLKVSFAVSSVGGHYVTFDGYCFTLTTVGEFYVINMPHVDFALQVRHVPCRLQSVCINAVAIRVSTTVISFHAPYTTNGLPVVWVDGSLLQLTGLLTNIGPTHLGIRLWLESHERYVIAWQDNFKIYLQVRGRYLSFKADVKTEYCLNSTGLLGSCDGKPDNDFRGSGNATLAAENVTQHEINTNLGNQVGVSPEENLVVLTYKHHHELHVATGAIHALLFNKSGASTGPLFKTFILGVDLTVEILFKPLQNGGTVFSYTTTHTFAITVNSTIRIHFGSQVFDTGVEIQVGFWSHVSLVWHRETKLLEFYHFDHRGKIQRRAYVFISSPFLPGGILSLGQWELSPGETELQIDVSFVGIIDEIRVWKTAFNPVVIQQNWRMNVLPTHPDVTGLWKVNEGDGDVINNLVSGEHIYIPQSPWQQPVWVFSDANVKKNLTSSEQAFEVHFYNDTVEKKARSSCFELFYGSELKWYNPCISLKAELDFYFLVCVEAIATTGHVSAALTAVISFSDHCEAVLSLSFPPARTLCNKFPGSRFPMWIGDHCDVKCVFGTADTKNRNLCVCDKGFWGEDCAKVSFDPKVIL